MYLTLGVQLQQYIIFKVIIEHLTADTKTNVPEKCKTVLGPVGHARSLPGVHTGLIRTFKLTVLLRSLVNICCLWYIPSYKYVFLH